MQTIHYTITDKKQVTTPDRPVLFAGESGTSEIIVDSSPADWSGYEIRALLTTPGGINLDAVVVGDGFELTNAMLDKAGNLRVEFGAYDGADPDAPRIFRSEAHRLCVNASRKETGTTPPDALPSVLAEISEKTQAAEQATTEALAAASAANGAAESCAGTNASVQAAEGLRVQTFDGFLENANSAIYASGHRLLSMTQAEYTAAVIDPDTYYIVTP